MAGIGLACVSGLSLVGCSDLNVDQSKVNTLIDKGLQYVERTDRIIPYEDIDSRLNYHAARLYTMLRNCNATVTFETKYYDSNSNLEEKITENTRYEYISENLYKIYHTYTNTEGAVVQEIYREISDTEVKTYVHIGDFKIKSISSISFAKEKSDFMSINITGNTILKSVDNEENIYTSWWNLIEEYFDGEYDLQVNGMEQPIYVLLELPWLNPENYKSEQNYIFSCSDYIIDADKEFFEMDRIEECDPNDSVNIFHCKDRVEIKENGFSLYSESSNIKLEQEILNDNNYYSQLMSLSIDEKNEYNINFDTNGYITVQEYYESIVTE